ncbi:hypothetical protein J4476_04620 [Candidatus Woesearchaeota archaeon]|nr:MAG: hypothetical protein QT09_C0015G0012 [archaeon GW2011_AR18]MBS3161948.1 hypothetical protein [Candidatus Woesearchaeota archaeon]HIH25806.1 hypothetical protein [Nanoarchaeota archaeon]
MEERKSRIVSYQGYRDYMTNPAFGYQPEQWARTKDYMLRIIVKDNINDLLNLKVTKDLGLDPVDKEILFYSAILESLEHSNNENKTYYRRLLNLENAKIKRLCCDKLDEKVMELDSKGLLYESERVFYELTTDYCEEIDNETQEDNTLKIDELIINYGFIRGNKMFVGNTRINSKSLLSRIRKNGSITKRDFEQRLSHLTKIGIITKLRDSYSLNPKVYRRDYSD